MIYYYYKFSIFYMRLWKFLILMTWMIFIHQIVSHYVLYI